MVDLPSVAESSVIDMIATAFTGSVPEAGASTVKIEKFEFDDEFQTKIAALTLRDKSFMRKTAHLLNPAHFENTGEALIVGMALRYFEKYDDIPAAGSYKTVILDDISKGLIRKNDAPLLLTAMKPLREDDLSGSGFAADQLSEFARHQAMAHALLASVDLLGNDKLDKRKKFNQIEDAIKSAAGIGINNGGVIRDYWNVAPRTEERILKIAGKLPPQGITTGIPRMDDLLYHRGWGRKELTIIMGGAKSGKTAFLINAAQAASLAGKNVLYVSCEVAARIIEERLDACITSTLMKELAMNMKSVESKLIALATTSGMLHVEEYASGTLRPSELRNLLEKRRDMGIRYDMVVVDYADIMIPDDRTDNSIENSKSVGLGLRALAFEFDVAMLTATQTNRDGYKATVAKAEHVAEDFNKIRTADLVISINKTEEEAKKGEARLYFAASRNQESGFTIIVKQDIARMIFVVAVLGIE